MCWMQINMAVSGSDSQLSKHFIFILLLHRLRRRNSLRSRCSQTEGHTLFWVLHFDCLLPLWFAQCTLLPPHRTAPHHSLEMSQSLQDTGGLGKFKLLSEFKYLKWNLNTHTHTDTHLLLAVLREARRDVIHVSSIREDARHALPQQLVSVDLCSSGGLLLLPALLCDPQPPPEQHLQQVKMG